MKHYLLLYFSTLLVLTLLDMLWIGGIARDFYKSRIDNLEFHLLPAVAFYLMYGVGIVVFVSGGGNASLPSACLYGALLGFLAYATYDLTNLATLRGWSLLLSAVDVAWGTFVTAVASAAGVLITGLLERS